MLPVKYIRSILFLLLLSHYALSVSFMSLKFAITFGKNHKNVSGKNDGIDIVDTRGMQKDITRCVVLKMNIIRMKNHIAVVWENTCIAAWVIVELTLLHF